MNWTTQQQRVLGWVGGFALVLAVAGAGKTTVLLGLIKRLLEEMGIAPGKILMTTFSKRGSLDMSDRAGRMEVPVGVEYRTLHSVAYEMVRSAGHRSALVIPPSWKKVRVIRNTLRTLEAEQAEQRRYGVRAGQHEWPLDMEMPKPGEVAKHIGLAKAALIWPDAWSAASGRAFLPYAEWATEQRVDPDLIPVIDRCYRAWEDAKSNPEAAGFPDETRTRWLTFDDMLAITARAILRGDRKDRWVNGWGGHYSHVLVDEVQDNNEAQWVIARHLAKGDNLAVVGDDQQSIFKFRGALPALMRAFIEADGAAVMQLTKNWRSGRRILDVGNRILAHATDRLYDGLLECGREGFEGDVEAREYHDAMEEAAGTVEEIAAMIEEGACPEEIACLYRLNACSGPLEVELIRRGIPYRVAGSSFFSQPAIKAAVGYLAVAIDAEDGDGFAACYNTPLRGLGRAIRRDYSSLTELETALNNGELGRRWRRGAGELVETVETVRRLLEERGTGAALDYLFYDLEIVAQFRDEAADAEDETEVDVCAKALIECADTLGAASDLVGFARTQLGVEDRDGEAAKRPMVTLSTIHKAKGLEWGTVFVVGMTEGLLGFSKGDDAEERRLAYVAVTRARDTLRVTWTLTSGGEKPRATGPSQFAIDAGLPSLLHAHGNDYGAFEEACPFEMPLAA